MIINYFLIVVICWSIVVITRGNLYQQWTYSSSRRQRRRTVCVTVTETSQAVEEEDISWVHVLISQVLKENGDDFKKMKSWSSKLISLYSRWWMKRHCYCEYGRSRLEASRLVKTKARAVEQWAFVRVVEANERRMTQCLEFGFWLRRERGWDLSTQGYTIRMDQASVRLKSQGGLDLSEGCVFD